MPGSLEPGFHIVQRHSTFAQLLMKLFDAGNAAPIARLQRLNPTFAQGFKAGEIFVIGDPDNGHACTREEAELMTAAERARVALTGLDESEADFMMQHIGEIAGLLNGASQSMGVGKDMLAYSLGRVEDTLKGIERLHQQEFMKHGHLNSSQFFASRKKLYHQLESQLRSAFLNRHLSLGDHSSLKRGLGISTKSLVHHWSKAGAPGQIPGYASHLNEVAKTSKFLQYGGHVGIGLGFSNSILKIYEACRAGETESCKKVRLKETGSFIGGMAGGGAGAKVGEMTGRIVCTIAAKIITKGAGSSICMIGIVGTGSFLGATSIGGTGEALGEVIYDFTTD
ncbi:hypothetical protein DA83_13665 [Pseudomonas sp. 250J]|nr:hypothetical protein DA83_13665 [Pseudomonas sp. 250J]